MNGSEFKGMCRCRCGEVKMLLRKPPVTRFYCHCAVCQEVYRMEFSDMTVTFGFNVYVDDAAKIEFKRQRFVPVSVKCGICKSCRYPVIGYSMLLPFLNIAYVPSYTYQEQTDVPESAGHIFYNHRVCDVDDNIPRYSGFAASQFAVARFILAGILK